jgi:dienelactone hydrolase
MRRSDACLVVSLTALALMVCPAARAQTPSIPVATPIPTGQVIGRVPCAGDLAQNYALYLPSTYSPLKAWPIIYAFDPGARGEVPVKLYKQTAEKYGYIIAASNNSRNFQGNAASQAAQAVWDDTHARLRLDAHRIYTMGFSGGARVATMLALRCAACAVAGVIAHGGSYPESLPASEKDRFAYLAFVGNKDFNWPELMELRRKKEQWGAPFRLVVFEGEHQWAAPAVFDAGIAWLQLKAMQAGIAPPDPSLIDQWFARTRKQAEDAAQHDDVVSEFGAYRSLAYDFSGLKDVSQFQPKLAALKSSAEWRRAIRQEQQAIDQQLAATQELSAKLAQVQEADLAARIALRSEIVDGMAALRNRAAHAGNEERRLVLLRAFNALWAQAIEAGQRELETNQRLANAEFYFELVSSVTPDQPWPIVLLAETDALRGDKRRALKHVHEAIRRGLQRPESLDENANLHTLRSEPEFQQMITELKARRDSQAAAQ